MIIITKNTQTPGKTPAANDLQVGELAVNTADGKLFVKHNNNQIKEIGGSGGASSGTPPELDLLRLEMGII